MTEFCEWRDAPKAEFAVIGDPVAHSKSPLMQNAMLASMATDARYVAIRVPKPDFEEAMERIVGLGFRGLNVTIPLKEMAFKWVDSLDAAAESIGAVNCIDIATRRGRNTDAPAFDATLNQLGLPTAPRVVLVGAGGAGAAVAFAVAARSWELSIWNRTRERGEQLASRYGGIVLGTESIRMSEFDLVVNATSGVGEVDLPIDWNSAKVGLVAYDLMYGKQTSFMRAASERGFRVFDGTEMLIEQGALSMEGWLGVSIDRAVFRRALGVLN